MISSARMRSRALVSSISSLAAAGPLASTRRPPAAVRAALIRRETSGGGCPSVFFKRAATSMVLPSRERNHVFSRAVGVHTPATSRSPARAAATATTPSAKGGCAGCVPAGDRARNRSGEGTPSRSARRWACTASIPVATEPPVASDAIAVGARTPAHTAASIARTTVSQARRLDGFIRAFPGGSQALSNDHVVGPVRALFCRFCSGWSGRASAAEAGGYRGA